MDGEGEASGGGTRQRPGAAPKSKVQNFKRKKKKILNEQKPFLALKTLEGEEGREVGQF